MEVSVRSDVACPTGTKDDWDASFKRVNGVPVEVVHATLLSRLSWVSVMVDLVAACSMHKGSYDNSSYIMWETSEVRHPWVSDLNQMQVNIGFNGELVAQPVAEKRGYIVKQHNSTVKISIPYKAEGVYRKSIVSGNLYKFSIFHLYLEQISVDEDQVSEERVFTVYLGDIPKDVELVAVNLNGQDFTVPFTNTSSHNIEKVVVPNHTHGYILKVPFEDPVMQQIIKDATIQHRLDINYTLTVLPENKPFYQLASVMAVTNASLPAFDAVCSESGISFKLDHQPIDPLWEIRIGSELLTTELADKYGYIISNNSQRLLLEVPLFTHGYKYKDFVGTFELFMRNCETEGQISTIKTCQFYATEL
ncbi:hypothetical protein FQN60_010586, partial [Etheostoma spectabile]